MKRHNANINTTDNTDSDDLDTKQQKDKRQRRTNHNAVQDEDVDMDESNISSSTKSDGDSSDDNVDMDEKGTSSTTESSDDSSSTDEDIPRLIPHIAKKIAPNPSSSSTNANRAYQTQPLPFPDDRVLYWELKRPEIEELPAVPEWYSNTEMECAKMFCVRHLADIANSVKEGATLFDWFSKQDAMKVINTYEMIRKELPKANQWIVEHSQLMVNATGANVCTTPLGSAVQAKGALFYIAKYMAKPNVSLGHCLTTLNDSMEHVKEYPSRSKKDSGTDKRTVQHYITRTLNSLATQVEIADTQAAAALLGIRANVCTHSFMYFSPHDAIDYIRSLQSNVVDTTQRDTPCINPTTTFRSKASAPLYTVQMREDDAGLPTAQDEHDHEDDYNEELPPTMKIPVPYAKFYSYRGKDLRFLNRVEYYTLIEIKPIKKDTFDVENEHDTNDENQDCVTEEDEIDPSLHQGGRLKSKPFRLHSSFDLHGDYFQRARSKQPIPIAMGYPPKHPGPPPSECSTAREQRQWQSQADAFAMYYLVSFRPEPDAYHGPITSLPYTWEAFCSWMEFLEASPRLVDQCRATSVIKSIYGLYSKNMHRELIFAYRSKDCTLWTQLERRAAEQYFATLAAMQHNNDDFVAATSAFDDSTPLSSKQELFAENEFTFCAAQAEALDGIYQDSSTLQPSSDGNYASSCAPTFSASSGDIRSTFDGIASYRPDANDATLPTSVTEGPPVAQQMLR